MIRFFKRHKLFTSMFLVIVAFVLIFLVPIIINHLYSVSATIPYLGMNWNAEVALTYYGTLIGAIATIVAVVVTINFTVDNQKRERKLSIKPYLVTKITYITDILDSDICDKCVYIKLSNYLEAGCGVPQDVKSVIKDLNLAKEHGASNSFIKNLATNTAVFSYLTNYYVMLYTIENCGANTAINFSISINDLCFENAMCIRVGHPMKIMFIFDDSYFDKKTTISLSYQDINSIGAYTQVEHFRIDSTINDFPSLVQFIGDRISKPIEH